MHRYIIDMIYLYREIHLLLILSIYRSIPCVGSIWHCFSIGIYVQYTYLHMQGAPLFMAATTKRYYIILPNINIYFYKFGLYMFIKNDLAHKNYYARVFNGGSFARSLRRHAHQIIVSELIKSRPF